MSTDTYWREGYGGVGLKEWVEKIPPNAYGDTVLTETARETAVSIREKFIPIINCYIVSFT